jgi:hypothetical protein
MPVLSKTGRMKCNHILSPVPDEQEHASLTPKMLWPYQLYQTNQLAIPYHSNDSSVNPQSLEKAKAGTAGGLSVFTVRSGKA